MTREPKATFYRMSVAIEDSLSNVPTSNNQEDGEDENDDDTEQGQLTEDDEPGQAMCRISKTMQQGLDRVWQNQMKLEESKQPAWEDAADYRLD